MSRTHNHTDVDGNLIGGAVRAAEWQRAAQRFFDCRGREEHGQRPGECPGGGFFVWRGTLYQPSGRSKYVSIVVGVDHQGGFVLGPGKEEFLDRKLWVQPVWPAAGAGLEDILDLLRTHLAQDALESMA